ncbi:MAG TPA: polysaccharide biosynthesis/export family protein [Candidatus Acidoferrales bacterium]|nr:polysaccharide biosynthesis/export family protein [Candidatus Acidoferrales bacterium]
MFERSRFWMLVVVILGATFSARAQGAAQAGQNQAAVAAANSVQKPVTQDPNYIIGPQDVLDISVWKENELTRTVPVRPDGKISLPLLNDVRAAGLTPNQLAAQITASLKRFVTDPQVTVIVTQINSQRVYILGEVARPGAFPLLPGMTILESLSTAGGFTPFANRKKIYMLRNENGKQVKYPFDYKAVIDGKRPDQDLVLQAGDTIVVP